MKLNLQNRDYFDHFFFLVQIIQYFLEKIVRSSMQVNSIEPANNSKSKNH